MFAGLEVRLEHDALGFIASATVGATTCVPQQFHAEVEQVFGALWLPVLAQCNALLDTEEDVSDAYAEAIEQWQESEFLDALAAEPCDFVDYDDGDDWDDEDEDEAAA